jgi:N4-gp56 family major capsid protein
MAQTQIPFGSPLAVKRWSGQLFVDTLNESYFNNHFMGDDDNKVIQRLTDLEQAAGDTITYDLSVQLRNKPTYGDQKLQGKEEALRFFQDTVKIDQIRHGVSAGGKMSNKRTLHNLRSVGKKRLSDYFSKFFDEMLFIYLSGARGINEDFIEDVAWTGHAGNALDAPDTKHQMYGGAATSKATIATTDKMSKNVVEKAATFAQMMRATDPTTANMLPVNINGSQHYVLVMSGFQEYDMRTADTTGWLDIQKAAAAAEGKSNAIFKGGLGMINNVVLHSHDKVIRFSDYGAGATLPAARALFMGRQAGVIAFGSAGGGMRFSWSEEKQDHGNDHVVAAGTIIGVKKSRFNSKDFGVAAIDTYAKDPNS